MDLADFRASLADDAPPEGVDAALAALWHQGRGEWETAHRLAQKAKGRDGDWVHAHLHRVEGDQSNANYWYRRAGQTAPSGSLEAEWAEIADALLGGGASDNEEGG